MLSCVVSAIYYKGVLNCEGQAALQGSLDRAEEDLAATLRAAAEETWRWASFLAEWQGAMGNRTGLSGSG